MVGIKDLIANSIFIGLLHKETTLSFYDLRYLEVSMVNTAYIYINFKGVIYGIFYVYSFYLYILQ